jgi:hypothetical protein
MSVKGEAMMIKLTFEDIDALDFNQLQFHIDRETKETGMIEQQLMTNQANEDNYEWYTRARCAMKVKRKLIAKMQMRRKDMKRAQHQTLSNIFMDKAREALSPDVFETIFEQASFDVKLNSKEGV